ncbi:MAG TPA: pantetheine-phosphate adenylyltransferase [Clostridiales bacterium]|jgi:pantetheine-phosphate adenylyltransferase|nr:pantetheine-phosphate adenylyltransferase [Clostridiales bacterium]HBE14437.1 pantetheine-phosphate adenylyltransferase [Clostridiales bacterium]
MKKMALCPGSFDPLTLGHYDIILRAAAMFDEVIVLVIKNTVKNAFLSPVQRVAFAEKCFEQYSNIRVDMHDGLLCEYAKEQGVTAIVKGVRGATDFEYESQLYAINRELENCETIFIPAKPEYAYISSTFVRDMILYNRPIALYLPPNSAEYLKIR